MTRDVSELTFVANDGPPSRASQNAPGSHLCFVKSLVMHKPNLKRELAITPPFHNDDFSMPFPLFLFTICIVLLTPGPSNTLLFTSGSVVGTRQSLPLIAAELVGYFLAVSAYRLGVYELSLISPKLLLFIRVALVAYLLSLSYHLWRYSAGSGVNGSRAIGPWHVFITALLNPKALLFALATFPPLPAGLSAEFLHYGVFAAVLLLVGLFWIAAGTYLGRVAPLGLARLWPRVAAVLMCGFATVVLASVVR